VLKTTGFPRVFQYFLNIGTLVHKRLK